MSNIERECREMAADIRASDGKTMSRWDDIRHQVETCKGSDLPRLNFEGMVEEFADKLDEAAAEIVRLRDERWRTIATINELQAALKPFGDFANRDAYTLDDIDHGLFIKAKMALMGIRRGR